MEIKKINRRHIFSVSGLPDFYTFIASTGSIIGLLVLIVRSYKLFDKFENPEFNYVITSLLVIIAILFLVFFLNNLFYTRRLSKLVDIPQDYYYLMENADRNDIIILQQAECSHLITHYFRNIDFKFEKVLSENFDEKLVNEILSEFHHFLINITASLQSYYTLATGSNSAITIKLLNPDTNQVKTYFRDPINQKKRKFADRINNGLCYTHENTAFDIIMDETDRNVYFVEDNLLEKYNAGDYKNPNKKWMLSYLHTLVVPISVITDDKERNIAGFLSVDTYRGELNVLSNREFLFFVADLLYCVFDKFNKVSNIVKKEGVNHELINKFLWEES